MLLSEITFPLQSELVDIETVDDDSMGKPINKFAKTTEKFIFLVLLRDSSEILINRTTTHKYNKQILGAEFLFIYKT